MTHTWRLKRRGITLRKIFDSNNLETIWKKYIKDGLRAQGITDLHDYNDLNNHRRIEYDQILNDVIAGNYKPRRPFIYTSEKRNGVCRHILIPAFRDAMFLQAIVEHILPELRAQQPSENAFFSRSHAAAGSTFHVEVDTDYPWFIAWRKFRKKREAVVTSHDFVAVTDIANFFDSIRLDQLRNIVSSLHRKRRDIISEVVLDLITETLNILTWVPDYLPRRHEGLVQVDFDAPRLFAHVYLYEVDQFLKQNNDDRFLRWVDDITLPGSSPEYLKNLLGQIDDLLYSRGCRLNLSKTTILTAEAAFHYFKYQENAYLDWLYRLKILDKRQIGSLRCWMLSASKNRIGHWDKVVGRAIRLLTKHRSPMNIHFAERILLDQPSLRRWVFENLLAAGYHERRYKLLIRYLTSEQIHCGESTFSAWMVLAQWPDIPSVAIPSLRKKLRKLAALKKVQADPITQVCALRLEILYGSSASIYRLCQKLVLRFGQDEFVIRQVAAALACLKRSESYYSLLRNLLQTRSVEMSASIIFNLDMIESDALANSSLKWYVLPPNLKRGYSLERFLIARACVRSKTCTPTQRLAIGTKVLHMARHGRIREMWLKEFGPAAPALPSAPLSRAQMSGAAH